jgi:hypothetical protein
MTLHSTTMARARRVAVLAAAASLAVGAATVASAAATSGRPRSASVADGTLTVTGSHRSDQIALRLAPGAPATLQVDFDDDGTADLEFDRGEFTAIVVSARNGDDRFRVDQANGAFADEALTVEGGPGDDVLDGGDNVELFVGGPGDDAVDGNRGNDSAVLGAGDDSFRWDPGDGSDVVEGSAGFDTLDFNGAAGPENMSLSPNGGGAVFLRDAGNIRMDLHRVERLDLTTLGDVDTVTIADLSRTGVKVADIDLSGPGGGGDGADDTVTVEGTARGDEVSVAAEDGRVEVEGLPATVHVTGSEPGDRLQINAGDGHDEVDVDDDVVPLVTVAVDLGAGQH